MGAAPKPDDESTRLRELRSYEILDSLAEPSFDRVTALVSRILDVPIALVSLVDAERQWFKSCVGLGDVRQTGRDVAFCAHAILANDVFVIPDAHDDERFRDNPFVTGPPHVRAYAGAPLVTPTNARVGTLCALDTRPRDFSGEQLATLVDLAAVVVDEMELRRAARERKLFERVSQLSPNLLYLVDTVKNRISWSNRSTSQMLGYAPGTIGEKGLAEVMHPEDVERAREHMARSRQLADGETNEDAFRVKSAYGYRWLLANETPFERDADGRVTEVLGIAADVNALKEAEDRAWRSERELANRVEVLEAILETAGEGILVVDEECQVIIANSIVRALTGAAPGDTLARTEERPLEHGAFHEDGRQFALEDLPLTRALRGENADNVSMLLKNVRHPEGVFMKMTARPVRDGFDSIRGAVVTMSDVTALKLAERRLAELAVTDELTRLPNRRALRDRLELLSAEAARGRRFSVAIVDIDHFKKVNDTHGHAVGDDVLVAVASALRSTVRRSDLVARMGGEEFCVVQTDVDAEMMRMLTERLRQAISSIDVPLHVTASFGVCHSGKTKNPVELLAAADEALYRAKHAGRNRVEVA